MIDFSKRRWGSALLGAVLVCCLRGASVEAADRYVATNGTGAGTSWSAAYTNIQEALDAAGDNDTLHLAGHVFILTNQVLWTGVTNLTIRGGYAATNDTGLPGARDPALWPTALARTNGTVSGYFRLMEMRGVTNGVLDGVRMAGGYYGFAVAHATDGGGAIRMDQCTNVSIVSCVITGNVAAQGGTYGTASGGGIWCRQSAAVISNCVIRENWVRACSGGYAAGMGIGVVSGAVTVVDTVITGNRGRGHVSNAFGFSGGGLHNNAGVVVVRNCLIAANLAANFGFLNTEVNAAVTYRGGGLHNQAGTLTVLNSTVANNGVDGVSRLGGTVAVTNCILWGNQDDVTGTVTVAACNIEDGDEAGANGNFSADPLFDRGFYLASNSPCINAGTGTAADCQLAAPYTTSADGGADTGTVDVGWHYRQGLGSQQLYVSPEGSDSNSGTNWVGALRSITQALRQAAPGTRVNVASGFYTNPVETFPLTVDALTGLQLVGTNADNTVLNAAGTSRRVMVVMADGVRIEGLTIRGGYTSSTISGEGGGGIDFLACNNIVLDSCIFTGNLSTAGGTYPMNQGGAIRILGGSVTLQDSLVASNTTSACSGANAYGGGISVAVGNLTAERSLFRANRAYGNAWNNAPAILGGAIANNGGSVRLRSCVLTTNITINTYASGLNGGRALANVSGVSCVENCTIVGNPGDGLRAQKGILAATNTILWGNGVDVTGSVILAYCNVQAATNTGVNGNISADPLFVGPTTNNFRLGTGSPCINAGINGSWMWAATDFVGGRRIQKGAVDIGAYEYDLFPNGTIFVVH